MIANTADITAKTSRVDRSQPTQQVHNWKRPVSSKAFLTFLSGPLQDSVVELTQAVTTLGADPTCDIRYERSCDRTCDRSAEHPAATPKVRIIRGDATWRLESLAGSIILDGREVRFGVLRDRAVFRLEAAPT